MSPKIVPNIVSNQHLISVGKTTSIRDAAILMAEHNIAAVLIMENRRLLGILTERDISRKIIAAGLDPYQETVENVMTVNPDYLSWDDTPEHALEMMREGQYRHLPVVGAGGRVVGMVSIRDLYDAVHAALERDLQQCNAYISGEVYGVAHFR